MPFDLQPILKGELLELRPLRPDDFARADASGSPRIVGGHLDFVKDADL
jgi:hypothetical protein